MSPKTDWQRREDRWIAIDDETVAMRFDDPARAAVERDLIQKWRAIGIPVPEILDENGGIQVRRKLHGITGEAVEPMIFGRPVTMDERFIDAPITRFGARLADNYGELARRLHSIPPIAPVRTPDDLDLAFKRLHASDVPADAIAIADHHREALGRYLAPTVVGHNDLHFHNMVLSPDGDIVGLFDLGDAHLAPPVTEFRYVHSLGPEFASRAIAAYGPIDEAEIRREHARVAICHLIWFPRETERHASILAWVTATLRHLL